LQISTATSTASLRWTYRPAGIIKLVARLDNRACSCLAKKALP